MKTEAKMKKLKKKPGTVFKISMVFCCLLFYASVSYGHRVYLFAWAEGDTIYTESYLSGNKKIKDGIIKVFNSEGTELLNGKTDVNGEFSFKVPEFTDLRIVLEASMGHGAEYLLKKSEFSLDQTHVANDLVKLREDRGPGIIKVISGIGCILGLMGIISYIRSKRKL